MNSRHRASGALIGLAAVVLLTGCTPTLAPDEIAWRKVAEGPIVAMNSSTGVYVSGFMSRRISTSGEITSEGVIDYQYARKLDDGGLREDLVSTTYERFAHHSQANRYPGSHVVTIYQDAKPDGANARIEIFECAVPEELLGNDSEPRKNDDEEEFLDPFGGRLNIDPNRPQVPQLPDSCSTPGGTSLDRHELRVDVHVPPGAVVEEFGDCPQGTAAAS